MAKSQFIFLTFLSTSCLTLFAQEDSLLWLNGKVINQVDRSPIPFAQIASYSEHLMWAADSAGHFLVSLPVSDSIKIIAIGHDVSVFRLSEMSANIADTVFFELKQTSILLNQVNINLHRGFFQNSEKYEPIKGKDSILINLNLPSDINIVRSDTIPASYKPTFSKDPPPLAALVHPLSYLYYYTSKKEKSRRHMVQILRRQEKQKGLSVELITEVSGFKGEQLQNFIVYCNQFIHLHQADSESQVRQKIFLALEKFTVVSNGKK